MRLTVLLGLLLGSAASQVSAVAACAPSFADEFNGDTLNSAHWTLVEGDGCDQNLCGWGNNERQVYHRDAAVVKAGMLQLMAYQRTATEIASARLTTQGKFSQRFGRFEARMKLPPNLGLWPAFWMLPADKQQVWPLEGEIDILEQKGFSRESKREILGAIHFGERWPNNTHYSESMTRPIPFDQDWHVYAVEWNEGEISWWVDEKQYGRATRADAAPHRWPFDDKPFYLLLNLAVGGTLGGDVVAETVPAHLLIDYVRAYPAGCGG
jgi:beta-glucanase (GH16 family)